jgi:serine/threonine-protein kinase
VTEPSSAEYRGKLGRYALFGEIAAGGMATVHLARLIGTIGFARTVAIKRLHPHLAKDPDFVAMFVEEARLAARVRHPNVVATLDVVRDDSELFLVMEYVPGESLARLVRKTREAGKRITPRFVVAMICAALDGLHAAHEATSERGAPLGLVHRDVSPQNIHVGVDGVARVLDFGIAKATNRAQETRTDQIKGKIAYMSPEQLAKGRLDRRADVYSASVVLWEALTGTRLFQADDVPAIVYSIMNDALPPPSAVVPDLPKSLDAIVMKGLERDAANRWSSARELAIALEKELAPAAPRDVGEWVEATAGEALAWRTELVRRIESETSISIPPGLLRRRSINSPPAPGEASGIVTSIAPTESDAAALEEDDDDKRATLLRADRRADWRAAQRRKTALVGLGLFALLLAASSSFLALRVAKRRARVPEAPATETPAVAPPATDEPAIRLGLSRSASPAPSLAPPPPLTPPASPPSAKPRPPEPKAPPANDCDPPYYFDAKTGRHPKPYCIKR